ncbi:MAG: OsmC family protein, partial [Anaerolineae bacterium]
MSERVIVRQNAQFETEFLIPDPHEPQSGKWIQVAHIHALTPYSMLLASLGSCTAIILNSYAENHDVDLEGVDLSLSYARVFDEDCEDCQRIERYSEAILQEITLKGNLTDKERDKLYHIAQHCPIERMLIDGIPVSSRLADGSP